MSLTLPNAQEDARARAAVAARDVDLSDFVLALDGEDVAPEVMEGEWGQDDSGAISLDFTLGSVLPRRLEEAPVDYHMTVDGVYVPLLIGPVSAFEVGESRTTTDPLWAATPAGLWARTTLDEPVEFNGWPAEQILREAYSRVPYPRGSVQVAPLGEDVLYFTRARGNHFHPQQYVSDIVDAVVGQTTYHPRDTAWGGHVSNPAVQIGAGGVPERVFDAADLPKWRPPSRTSLRYSRVVVQRELADGKFAFREAAPIKYPGQRPPLGNQTFYLTLEDDAEGSEERASQLAYDYARRFSRGVYGGETVWPYFDPFVEGQDVFGVNEDHQDMDGTWARFWVCWVKTYRHVRAQVGEGSSEVGFENPLRTLVVYEATLLEEELIKVPALVLPGVTGGVVRTRVVPAPRGSFTHWGQTNLQFRELTDETYGEMD